MPTCPRCKMAFLVGETHTCKPRSRRPAIILGVAVAIYAAAAVSVGSVFQPGAVVLYLLIVLVMGIGRVVGQVLHLFAG